jgi:hypothetical protein
VKRWIFVTATFLVSPVTFAQVIGGGGSNGGGFFRPSLATEPTCYDGPWSSSATEEVDAEFIESEIQACVPGSFLSDVERTLNKKKN